MCRATSVANASSELRRAYSRSRSMSSVGIYPYIYAAVKGNRLFLRQTDRELVFTRRRFIAAARVNARSACLDASACSHFKHLLVSHGAGQKNTRHDPGAVAKPLARRAAASYGCPGM